MGEAEFITDLLQFFIGYGLGVVDIGVITLYKAQMSTLNRLLQQYRQALLTYTELKFDVQLQRKDSIVYLH